MIFRMNRVPDVVLEAEKRVFLRELALTGRIAHSAAAAGHHRVWAHQQRHKDPGFSAGWEEALATYAEALEAEAERRAAKGVAKPLFHQGQPVFLTRTVIGEDGQPMKDENGRDIRELVRDENGQPIQAVEYTYSDALLNTLLKGNLPKKYRENASVELTGADGGPVQVALSEADQARRIAFLLAKGLRAIEEKPAEFPALAQGSQADIDELI